MYKLLIVDDEFWIRKRIKSTIPWEEYGISSILDAQDGREALTLSLEAEPDILITDINMPILSGLELMETLNQSGFFPKTILISGYDDFKYAQQAIKLGVKDYILKPIDEKILIEKVRDCINEIESDNMQKNLFSFIEKTRPKLQKQLLYELLNEEINLDDFIESFASTGLALPYNAGICFSTRLNEEHVKVKPDTARMQLTEIMSQVISRSFNCFQILSFNKQLTVVMFCPNSVEDLETATYYICEEILEYINENTAMDIAFGVGTYAADLSALSDSYTNSIHALSCTEELGWNDIYVSKTTQIHPLIENAELYIKKYYAKKLTLSHIAAYFYVNTSYFCKLFKKETGKTFTQYLAKVRMHEAKKLLKDPSLKVYDVASAVGYDNEQYFSTLFKELEGVSPTKFKSLL